MTGGASTATRRDDLADRVREVLIGREVREVKMFGTQAFMVEGKLVVCAGRDGDLLVHVDPARHDELLQLPGARDSFMGEDRPMGRGWITVAGSHLTTTEELGLWIDRGLEWRAMQA